MSRKLNKLEKASLILESNWFDTFFWRYFIKDADSYHQFLNKKRYRLSDKDISSRVLHHWIKEGIFHDDRNEGKGWRQFSISDMMIITIITRLRAFGMELSKIKKVKEYLDSYNSVESISSCLLLDFYIAYSEISKEPIQLVVCDNGDAILVRQTILNEMLQMGILLDYIVIDINTMYNKGSKFPNMTKYIPSEIEKEIKKSMKTHGLETINIRMKKKDYVVTKEMLAKDKKSANALMNLLSVAKRNKKQVKSDNIE